MSKRPAEGSISLRGTTSVAHWKPPPQSLQRAGACVGSGVGDGRWVGEATTLGDDSGAMLPVWAIGPQPARARAETAATKRLLARRRPVIRRAG
jgi:hypothetical protein